ncbi:MAG TPA: PAS domain-containing protein, partial [Polyangiales bacterium]|nr:PAS domain-containing protein [Polyangiales bacterium]
MAVFTRVEGRSTAANWLEVAGAEQLPDAEKEARTRLLQRVAGLGMWSWDLQTKRIAASSEVLRICGLERAEDIETPESAARVVHSDDLAGLRAQVRSGLERENPLDLEFRIVRPSGEVRWVNAAAEVVRDEHAKAVRVLGSLLDVTQHKRVETVLRESERRLLLLHELDEATRGVSEPDTITAATLRVLCEHLQASRCVVATVDGDRVVATQDYNRNCTSIVGRYRVSAFGPELYRAITAGVPMVIRDAHAELPADAAAALDAFQVQANISCALIRDGSLRAVVSVHQTTPRDWTPAEVSLVQEVVERCWSTIEQRAAEERLRENEALLQIASRAARIGGWIVELPDEQVVWSDEVCRMLEVPSGSTRTVGEALDMFAPSATEQVRAALAGCQESGTPFDFELHLQSARGRKFWARVVGEAERDAQGTVARIHGALQDVDDRRRLEEQLRQAQRLDAVGKLAGGIAHDFNNLLTVILSYSELIGTELHAADPLRSEVAEIRRAAVRASELTQQLLAFSRQQLRQPRMLDLNQVVHNMEKMLGRVVGEQISLVLQTADFEVPTFADPGQIEQVIMNLVLNARDAMPNGGTMTIETANVDPERGGRDALLSVSDTGVGMSEATRAHIFEPFFTTKDKSKGTGLGLATVHGIVAQSGGRISVQTELGRGTTF